MGCVEEVASRKGGPEAAPSEALVKSHNMGPRALAISLFPMG